MNKTICEIKTIFERECAKEGLDVKLSFVMPRGYESAFGTYDHPSKTLFLNAALLDDRVKLLFNFFHEFRHAAQYSKPENFSRSIQASLPYVILFDGRFVKMGGGEGRLPDGDYFDMYASLPYELDANKYAYNKCKPLLKDSECAELEALYQKSKPKRRVPFAKQHKIFNIIDEMTK